MPAYESSEQRRKKMQTQKGRGAYHYSSSFEPASPESLQKLDEALTDFWAGRIWPLYTKEVLRRTGGMKREEDQK